MSSDDITSLAGPVGSVESTPSLSGDINMSKVLSRYGEYLSDIAFVEYTSGGTPAVGFTNPTPVFNDNVTFLLPEQMSVRNGFRAPRDVLGGDAKISRGNGGSSKIRVICNIPTGLTREQAAAAEAQEIQLVDIDYTVDACNIVTREQLLQFLRSRCAVEVADRGERAVGRNCLSWWSEDANGDRVRIKVYNTFAQVLESAGVRVLLGSGLHSMLKGSVKADTLLEHKEAGVSRIELTFYGSTFKEAAFYRSTVDAVVLSLAECPTHRVSLSQQWSVFQAAVTQISTAYHVETSTFAYCHWWNSLTGMMQGSSRQLRSGDELHKMLGNYGFYDRDIHLVTITDSGESTKTYVRVTGGSRLTMCCGPKGGLYPSGGSRMLSEYGEGVGKIGGGHLGWPATYSYRSRALASVDEVPDPIEQLASQLESLTITNRDYKPAAVALVVGRQYIVCGTGTGTYRGSEYTYAKLDDGTRVRCGPSLDRLIQTQAAEARVCFSFVVDRIVNNCGKKDAVCILPS